VKGAKTFLAANEREEREFKKEKKQNQDLKHSVA
jgi:hypothetical protein